MPNKVYDKLKTAFPSNSKAKKLSKHTQHEKMVKAMLQVMGDLRLRSQQLNMQSLLWTLFLQSSSMSTAVKDAMHSYGLTVTQKTAMGFLQVVSKAFSELIVQVIP